MGKTKILSLTPQQLHAARLVFEGHGNAVVGETVGVHRNTIADWKRLPAFERTVAEFEQDYKLTMQRLGRQAAKKGLKTLVVLAGTRDEDDQKIENPVRVQAAKHLTSFMPLQPPAESRTELSGAVATVTLSREEYREEMARLQAEEEELLARLDGLEVDAEDGGAAGPAQEVAD